jgi:C-terminal processing protease CtpA/Prc
MTDIKKEHAYLVVIWQHSHLSNPAGGPAYMPLNSGGLQGQRIDKGDQIVKIDGKEVTSGNLIPLLRGRDVVGSPVTVEIQKESEQEPRTFTLHRADIRHKSSFAA